MEENNMHFKKISLTLLSIFILSLASSCNQSKNTGSSTISSSPTPIEYPSLKEAIENTQEYAITMVGREEDPEGRQNSVFQAYSWVLCLQTS